MSAQPPTIQFRTEIVDNSVFPPFDGWKDITVHCTNPGGGGFAPSPTTIRPAETPGRSGRARCSSPTAPATTKPVRARARFLRGHPPGARRFRLPHQLLQRRLLQRHGDRLRPGQRHVRGQARMTSRSTGPARSVHAAGADAGAGDGRHSTRRISPAPTRTSTRRPTTCVEHRSDRPRTRSRRCRRSSSIRRKCLPSQALLRGKMRGRPLVQACKSNESRVDGKCVKIPGVSIHCLPGYVQIGMECVKKPVIATPASATKAGRRQMRQEAGGEHPLQEGLQAGRQDCVRLPTLTEKCEPTRSWCADVACPSPTARRSRPASR